MKKLLVLLFLVLVAVEARADIFNIQTKRAERLIKAEMKKIKDIERVDKLRDKIELTEVCEPSSIKGNSALQAACARIMSRKGGE